MKGPDGIDHAALDRWITGENDPRAPFNQPDEEERERCEECDGTGLDGCCPSCGGTGVAPEYTDCGKRGRSSCGQCDACADAADRAYDESREA